jgi:hypothetical protein
MLKLISCVVATALVMTGVPLWAAPNSAAIQGIEDLSQEPQLFQENAGLDREENSRGSKMTFKENQAGSQENLTDTANDSSDQNQPEKSNGKHKSKGHKSTKGKKGSKTGKSRKSTKKGSSRTHKTKRSKKQQSD